jgi:lipoprotein-anchoring transpeptidase ErfK/SrfK
MRRWVIRVVPAVVCAGAAVAVALSLSVPAGALPAGTSSAKVSAKKAAADPGSMLRLQQLLAQLGYLPVSFTPAPGVSEPATLTAEEATRDQPLAGSFAWRWKKLPSSLTSQWMPGKASVVVKGALMAFAAAENFYNYTMDDLTTEQLATSRMWTDLFKAAFADKSDPNPYAYVYVTQNLPETLTLWENGKVVLTTPANTGISTAPTANGTFPIYLRLTYQVMKGTNPDGVKYADPVWWINYFNGGDAVHGFIRGSYGWPQSLGCVELPVPTAKVVFPKLGLGDLVTVVR